MSVIIVITELVSGPVTFFSAQLRLITEICLKKVETTTAARHTVRRVTNIPRKTLTDGREGMLVIVAPVTRRYGE